jgi:hypothetical protein
MQFEVIGFCSTYHQRRNHKPRSWQLLNEIVPCQPHAHLPAELHRIHHRRASALLRMATPDAHVQASPEVQNR